MRIVKISAFLAALLVAAAPALAATGQCHDAYGRPVGGPFDTFNPNRAFIDAVIARGGTCTVSEAPAQGYRYRDAGQDPAGRHADWCGTNPPSGYCIAPEMR